MKTLGSLCGKIASVCQLHGDAEQGVSRLVFSHEKVLPGALFAACRGMQVDGHAFIDPAIQRGATAILCEELPAVLHPQVAYVQVPDTRRALAETAAAFYDYPSQSLSLVGITGTNGKTTVATLLYELFHSLGKKAGLLATTGYRFADQQLRASHTTPDAVTVHRLLREMVSAGCTHCFMEVSSHALSLHRTTALDFCGGIFTNLTHDHLDFHKTFAAYRDAKKSFFDHLPETAFALVNADDKNGAYMVQSTRARVSDYALKSAAHAKGKVLESTLVSLCVRLWEQEVHFRLLGAHNAYNLVAAAAAAECLGQERASVLLHLSKVPPVQGRLEVVSRPEDDVVVVVDYAHTPDALEWVLESLFHFKGQGASLITLVGCGGDRDVDKRSKMAKIATRYSTHVVLTTDNPRSEPPPRILKDMQCGLTQEEHQKTRVIEDRKAAIHEAIALSRIGDLVLLAGKGHEDYQEIKGIRHPFSDHQVAKEALRVRV